MDMGITMREVAVTLGVATDTLRGWEHDAHEPCFRQFPAMFEFLGYDPFPAPKRLREQLRRIRMRHGWRQDDLAEALGVDRCTVTGWESGRHRPIPRLLTAIRRMLHARSLE